jgi:hypothetical protein
MQQPKDPQNIVNPGIITYVETKKRKKKERLMPDRTPLSCRVKDAAACEQCAGGRSFAVSWFDDAKPTGMPEELSKAPTERSQQVEKYDDKR